MFNSCYRSDKEITPQASITACLSPIF